MRIILSMPCNEICNATLRRSEEAESSPVAFHFWPFAAAAHVAAAGSAVRACPAVRPALGLRVRVCGAEHPVRPGLLEIKNRIVPAPTAVVRYPMPQITSTLTSSPRRPLSRPFSFERANSMSINHFCTLVGLCMQKASIPIRTSLTQGQIVVH